MFSNKSLPISGFQNHQIPNSLTVQPKGSSKLAVVFSGYGYSTEAPVLYMTKSLLFEKGFDLLSVDFNYNKNAEFQRIQDSEKDIWFESDCTALLDCINGLSEYSQHVYIGKSLGSSAILDIIEKKPNKGPEKILWFTPGTKSSEIYSFLEKTKIPSLVIAGSLDSYYKNKYKDQISANKNVQFSLIQNADHCLANPKSTLKSIPILTDIITLVDMFIFNKL